MVLILPMATVIPFPTPSQQRPADARIFFHRTELMALLSIYSMRVAEGAWRDYAIDHLKDRAAFSVFRSTHEAPLYMITKQVQQKGKKTLFSLHQGPKLLMRAQRLQDVLDVLQRRLELVKDN